MNKQALDLHQQIIKYKTDNGLIQRIGCTKEETKVFRNLAKNNQPLPEDVHISKDDFSDDNYYRIHSSDLSDTEIAEYLMYKQLDSIMAMKGYMYFFVVLTIVDMLVMLFITLWVNGLIRIGMRF